MGTLCVCVRVFEGWCACVCVRRCVYSAVRVKSRARAPARQPRHPPPRPPPPPPDVRAYEGATWVSSGWGRSSTNATLPFGWNGILPLDLQYAEQSYMRGGKCKKTVASVITTPVVDPKSMIWCAHSHVCVCVCVCVCVRSPHSLQTACAAGSLPRPLPSLVGGRALPTLPLTHQPPFCRPPQRRVAPRVPKRRPVPPNPQRMCR